MSVWAVVPVKSLEGAKRRLAPLLTPGERATLVAVLLAGVVQALQGATDVERVVVISPDPLARALGRELGGVPIADPWRAERAGEDEEASLNAALDYAASIAAAAGATALLALPADLPLVTTVDVEALLALAPAAPAVVVAPTADGGTGALLRSPPLAIPACFGPHSVRAHLALARTAPARAQLVWRAALTVDCDRPADLLRLAAGSNDRPIRALLDEWRIAERAMDPALLRHLETEAVRG